MIGNNTPLRRQEQRFPIQAEADGLSGAMPGIRLERPLHPAAADHLAARHRR